MSKNGVLEALQYLTPEETLEVIEVASHLLRQNIALPKNLSLVQAAERMRSFYQIGSELTQWTDEDPEEFQDYQNPASDESWDAFMEFIDHNAIETGISDLAHQHDHYLHGTPKRESYSWTKLLFTKLL